MSTIIVLTKTGRQLKTEVQESVEEVLRLLNNKLDPNSEWEHKNYKDHDQFIMFTDIKGKALGFNKRYIYKVV